MLNFHLKLSKQSKDKLRKKLTVAEKAGDLALVRRVLSVLAMNEGRRINEVATILGVSGEAVRDWTKRFLVSGLRGLYSKRPLGRPPKLNKTHHKE